MQDVKEQIIAEIRRIANELDRETISSADFEKLSNISLHQIYKNFGKWTEAVTAAGLTPQQQRVRKTHDELFQNLHDVCIMLDKLPTTMEFERTSNHAIKPYQKNFGSWQNALVSFKGWLQENHPDSQFIDMIDDNGNERIASHSPINGKIDTSMVWEGKKGIVYGAPLDFKGLRHEPTNEQGVVFLFGKINEDLGILVEAVKTGFPDCVGKRLIDRSKNLWEPVLIEFEYKSKNFLAHGHDISGCDVIVCWIHDWNDCPLEVIELRSIIKSNKFL